MNKPKNPAAVALGRAGGKKRAENMTKEDRSASAKAAAAVRWAKAKGDVANEVQSPEETDEPSSPPRAGEKAGH